MPPRRSGIFVVAAMGAGLALMMYPIAIEPMLFPDVKAKYRLSSRRVPR